MCGPGRTSLTQAQSLTLGTPCLAPSGDTPALQLQEHHTLLGDPGILHTKVNVSAEACVPHTMYPQVTIYLSLGISTPVCADSLFFQAVTRGFP